MKQSKWVLNSLTAVAIVGILAMPMAHAGGGSTGGGDEVGLEFQTAFLTAMSELKSKLPEVYGEIQPTRLLELSKTSKFIVVDETTDVLVQNLIQNSVAVNNPSTGKVLINRLRWDAINQSRLKEGIALHEVLSLAGMEQTGSYPFSSQYVAAEGLTGSDLSGNFDAPLPPDSIRCSVKEFTKEQLTHVWDSAANSEVDALGNLAFLRGAKGNTIWHSVSAGIRRTGQGYELYVSRTRPTLIASLMYPADVSATRVSTLRGANVSFTIASSGLRYELGCE